MYSTLDYLNEIFFQSWALSFITFCNFIIYNTYLEYNIFSKLMQIYKLVYLKDKPIIAEH